MPQLRSQVQQAVARILSLGLAAALSVSSPCAAAQDSGHLIREIWGAWSRTAAAALPAGPSTEQSLAGHVSALYVDSAGPLREEWWSQALQVWPTSVTCLSTPAQVLAACLMTAAGRTGLAHTPVHCCCQALQPQA